VKAIFLSEPVVPAFYKFGSAGSSWAQRARVLSVSRVENSGQEGSSRATYKNIDAALKSDGAAFMGGVHSRWLFHGTDHETMLKIVNNPIGGFYALASQRVLWGVRASTWLATRLTQMRASRALARTAASAWSSAWS
jgi:hypothetical protein